MKSFFDFIGRTETEMYSRLSRNTETGDSDKEALFASAGGVEVSEFLGGDTRLASRGVREPQLDKRLWLLKATATRQATRAAQSYRFSQNTLGSSLWDENWLGAEAGQKGIKEVLS